MPFINREMNRLRIVKNIELKKNKSLNNLSNKKKVRIQNLKSNNFCKIYRYYYSKNKIEEILMNQRIKKLRKDLKEKQEKEKNEYNDTFHKNYPLEDETEYNNEIKEIIKNKKEEEDLETIKHNFYEKKHGEYITKMGIEFDKGFDLLNQKFIKEKEEQNINIKKIILNRQIKEMEKSSKKDDNDDNEDNNDNYININDEEKNKNNNNSFFYSKLFYKYSECGKDNRNYEENGNIFGSKLKSKIFKFYARGNLHKTIII